jgi:hypothetical protein
MYAPSDTHTHTHTHTLTNTFSCIWIHTYVHTYTQTHIHTYVGLHFNKQPRHQPNSHSNTLFPLSKASNRMDTVVLPFRVFFNSGVEVSLQANQFGIARIMTFCNSTATMLFFTSSIHLQFSENTAGLKWSWRLSMTRLVPRNMSMGQRSTKWCVILHQISGQC